MVDWKSVLLQLRGTGLSYGAISIATNVPCGTLRMLVARRSQPIYTTGESVVRYWCERMGKDRAELPQVATLETQVVTTVPESTEEISTLRECG